MKTTKRPGSAARGASTFSSPCLQPSCSSHPSSWPFSGSSTTKVATASMIRPNCSTSIRLWWLAATSPYQDSVSLSLVFSSRFGCHWRRFYSRAPLPHLSLLLTLDRQAVPHIFPCLLHSMHRHWLFGRLGVEEREQHTSLLLATFLARLHNVWTVRVSIRFRILQVTFLANFAVDFRVEDLLLLQFSYLVVLWKCNAQVPLNNGSDSC